MIVVKNYNPVKKESYDFKIEDSPKRYNVNPRYIKKRKGGKKMVIQNSSNYPYENERGE